MRKYLGLLAALLLISLFKSTAAASDTKDVVVALGADLSESQRAVVLELMGLTEEELADCKVVYITNDMEHKYLDSYLDSSVIGSKSLSSVKLTKSAGAGVIVTTQNINYCTTGMYRNALMTAGMEDMEVLVVAPTPISGTAGLIGALKAYEEISGKTVADSVLDTSLDEMITTGELAQSIEDADSEEVESLIAWLKGKIAGKELDMGDEAGVKAVIEEGEEIFGVSLTDEEKDSITSLLKKLDSLGLDADYLIEQTQALYDKYGLDLVENANDAINEAVGNAFTRAVENFFQGIKNAVSNFFKSIFH